jgi:hypothetical protein
MPTLRGSSTRDKAEAGYDRHRGARRSIRNIELTDRNAMDILHAAR